MSPRAIIAEDEPLLAAQLATLLAGCWPELTICASASNGIDALGAVERERPDVVFLDIRMPGLTDLEVAAEIADRLDAGDRAPAIVFVTAYDDHALEAFKLAAGLGEIARTQEWLDRLAGGGHGAEAIPE